MVSTSPRSASRFSVDEAPNFFKSIEGRSYEELTPKEQQKLIEISKTAKVAYDEISTIVNEGTEPQISSLSSSLASAQYLEDEMSKAIEAVVYAGLPNLSVAEIAISFLNSNDARDIGINYAALQGYSVTWDNPADAYRHFSWNWFNSEDINVNDARSFGDYHELALVAANYVNPMGGKTYDEKVAIGVAKVFSTRSSTQGSLSTFNSVFDNASIMDITNNSQGRKYSLNYSFSNVADAFYAAYFTNDVLIGYLSEITSSVRSTAYSYWQ
ncbi:DUF6973 domain-containing protein [Paenibacillus germinis]|uniref:DUF6973 domain-containing protein n=1 Tax=Paenibacillus germinis TaxID=2654979 RepID=UPI0014931E96|nr:hypothetical protein [Paenibacillus germinis]